jgi:predicted metalloprotease with PDZ domain
LLIDARSGLWSAEQFRDELARTAANLDHATAREWRPLLDTAIAAPLHASVAGHSWRGISDYYYEMVFVWMEADMLIRAKSGGKRSLDDFCKAFFGGPGGKTGISPYAETDIFNALDQIAANDWRSFFHVRLTSTSARPPFTGLEASGWRLVYNEKPPPDDHGHGMVDLSHAMGLVLSGDGTIIEVLFSTEAWRAGLRTGMKVLAINDQRWSPAACLAALQACKAPGKPCNFLIEDGNRVLTYACAYRDGVKFPHLERDASKPDVLGKIMAPAARVYPAGP